MFRPRDSADGDHERDGIVTLVKETADGLGRLIGDHIKLARTEIVADAKSYGRDAAILVLALFVLALGYGLACVAGALALGHLMGRPLAFAVVAGLHLVGGGIGAAVALRAVQRTRPMAGTIGEVSRSMTALSASASAPTLPPTSLAPEQPDRQLLSKGRPA